MKFRRQFLVSGLVAFALTGINVQAQDNVLRVGTDATFPPMEFVENDKRTGFDIELVEAMAKAMGKRVEWIDIDFKGLIPGLVAKRFDVAVSAIYITDDRKKVVDFTDAYFAGGLVAMTKESNSAIKTLADLDGKKVTVQVGTKSVSYLQQNHPKVQLVEVEKNQEMFNLVEIGRDWSRRCGSDRQTGSGTVCAHTSGHARAGTAVNDRGIRHGAAQGHAGSDQGNERCAHQSQGRRHLCRAGEKMV